MNTNVNLEAALGVLGFLGACALLFIILIIAAHALFMRKRLRLKLALAAIVCLLTLYLGLMLAFSLLSTEKRLARGEEKHFCEIDCHLAYAVSDLVKTKTIGEGANQAGAAGVFYVVTVRTRFDEQTISRGRGDASLTPNSRVLTVRDARGQSFDPSVEGMRALELSSAGGTPIWTALRPGESYNTTYVFDLPETVASPALLIREGELVTPFIIGHENSPLHKKVLFRLDDAQRPVANVTLSRRLSWQIKDVASAVLRRLKGYHH
jgi:hypothetical protein